MQIMVIMVMDDDEKLPHGLIEYFSAFDKHIRPLQTSQLLECVCNSDVNFVFQTASFVYKSCDWRLEICDWKGDSAALDI